MKVELDGVEIEPPSGARFEVVGGELYGVWVEGRLVPVRVARDGGKALVWCAGETYVFTPAGTPRAPGRQRAENSLISPMPGKVLRRLVAEGEHVEKNATLLILEAMKMEHEIRAPHAGTIAKLPYAEGDRVEAGVPLVEFGR